MTNIFWSIVNSIEISTSDVSVIIGVIVVIFFGKVAIDVWNTISGR